MKSRADRRLPEPVDPAAPPRYLARAAGAAVSGGLVLLFLGAVVARHAADPDRSAPLVPAEVFLAGWLLSLPLGAALLLAYVLVGRRRLRHHERRAGFLPRAGRMALPATGRRTLCRVEYGSRADRLCLMVARWDYGASTGWRRGGVVASVWLSADDAVGIGEQRARLAALAEELEEKLDDARLGGRRERVLADEALAEAGALSAQSHHLAEDLARESR